MILLLIRAAPLFAFLASSACLLVSDEEIAMRIANALPSNLSFEIIEIDKSVACVAATFLAAEPFEISMLKRDRLQPQEFGLGTHWHSSNSFLDYTQIREQPSRISTVEGTIVHAKRCMDGVDFNQDRLYGETITVTQSRSGKELLIFFDQTQPRFGIYLAQGR